MSLIKINNTLFCPICQLRLPENKKICNHSKEDFKEFPFLLGPATDYGNPIVQNLIHYYKYKSFENLAPFLGELMINYLNFLNYPPSQKTTGVSPRMNTIGGFSTALRMEEDASADSAEETKDAAAVSPWRLHNSFISNFSPIVVFIPLHHSRERKRGFNQAKLLAEIVAKNFNLELKNVLMRVKNTPPQAQAENREKRRENLFGAFTIIDPDEIKNKNIILIDDVYTSGATMSEAARVLKSRGARKIIALVAAKA